MFFPWAIFNLEIRFLYIRLPVLQIFQCVWFSNILLNFAYSIGGVGCAATQLAKTVQDTTIVGTASASKHEKLKNNGVSHVLHYENYVSQAKQISPQGFDLIIDSIGGPNIEISRTLLKPCGRLVIIGNSNLNMLRTHKLVVPNKITKNLLLILFGIGID